MKADRFDALARMLSARRSRRSAARAAGLAIAAGVAGTGRVAAQDASPTPAVPAEANAAVLFVQTGRAGSFLPKDEADKIFTLTLDGVTDQTVYFTDRPAREVGILPTQTFLDGVGFTRADPPNAALVAQTAEGEDILVVELFAPSYDADGAQLTYEARILANYADPGLASLAEKQQDDTIAPAFDAASLFIDGCGKGQCWNGAVGQCVSCQCFQLGVQGCPCVSGTRNPCYDPSMVCETNPGSPPGSTGACWYP